jgi:protein-L-isoaspartate O-methyltransferase
MTSSGEMPTRPEATRLRSRATWNAVATGWYTQREEIWESSRLVSKWMIRRLDPQPGDTVLELAAGVDYTGLRTARSVGRSGRVTLGRRAAAKTLLQTSSKTLPDRVGYPLGCPAPVVAGRGG